MKRPIQTIALTLATAFAGLDAYNRVSEYNRPQIGATWDQERGVVMFCGDEDILCEVIDEFHAKRPDRGEQRWVDFVANCKQHIRSGKHIAVEAKDNYTFHQWQQALDTVMERRGY